MSLNIFIPEHPLPVYILQNLDEFVEFRVGFSEIGGFETVCFRPVRSTLMFEEDVLELVEEGSVGYQESVWPLNHG